jgi:class 3 adenylate cyclase
MIQFGGSFLPVHFVGTLLEGTLPAYGSNLSYTSGVGNGRGSAMNRGGDFGDINNNRAWLLGLSSHPDHPYGLVIGGSVYRDKVSPAIGLESSEWIQSGHIVWQKENPEFIAEFSNVAHRTVASSKQFNSQAWYVQTAYRLPFWNSLYKPYYRFEYIHIPIGDTIFRAVSGLAQSTIGVRYDVSMTDQLSTTHSQLTLANRELESRHNEVAKQREVAESLLLNILPAQVADELRAKDSVDPKYFEDVTILFTDFVGFSASTLRLSAEDLVHLLHDYFTAFDQITTRYGIEKLKTIGDSYMCVGGMPARTPSHPVDTVMAAFEMVEAVQQRALGGEAWRVRVGIHTGPVIAGVVGIKKFAFDIWGESVNFSSRMGIKWRREPNQYFGANLLSRKGLFRV